MEKKKINHQIETIKKSKKKRRNVITQKQILNVNKKKQEKENKHIGN
jgi:hypothetical protein